MSGADRSLLRRLADWDPKGVPVTSIYLTVDGRRFPRRVDYEMRLDELVRRARSAAEGLKAPARRSVEADLERISGLVRSEFERGGTRGLAMFAASAADLWEEVRLARPVRDRAVVAPQADLAPLEAVVEMYRPTCIALVDSEKARVFLAQLGEVEEIADLFDDVPGRHDQGGWSQMRMQRHVDVHRHEHLKRVAEALFKLWKRRGFDRVVLGGPGEVPRELEPMLHEYVRSRIAERITMPMHVTIDDVRRRTLEVEEELERRAEQAKIAEVSGAVGSGDRGVAGLEPTLEALAEGRAGEVVVAIDLSAPGRVCPSCGRLTIRTGRCPRCGSRTAEVPDVVEAAVAAALRSGSRVEIVTEDGAMEALEGVGALLRF